MMDIDELEEYLDGDILNVLYYVKEHATKAENIVDNILNNIHTIQDNGVESTQNNLNAVGDDLQSLYDSIAHISKMCSNECPKIWDAFYY